MSAHGMQVGCGVGYKRIGMIAQTKCSYAGQLTLSLDVDLMHIR